MYVRVWMNLSRNLRHHNKVVFGGQSNIVIHVTMTKIFNKLQVYLKLFVCLKDDLYLYLNMIKWCLKNIWKSFFFVLNKKNLQLVKTLETDRCFDLLFPRLFVAHRNSIRNCNKERKARVWISSSTWLTTGNPKI